MISQTTVDAVRRKASILDAMEGTPLKRHGREFLALCPWHNDRRPSLSVNPDKGFCYCHVCQHGTDALGWLQDRGLTFAEAVESLAARYGIPVELENDESSARYRQEQAERAAIYRRREEQAATFALELMASPGAVAYLEGRGVDAAMIDAWGLGLNGRRIMVPIRDRQGRVIAFTGRALDPGTMPKWKNSPGDLLYDKGRVLFGLDMAAQAIRETGAAVVVEGQLDVLQMHRAGFAHTVAASGTALSVEQVETLRRHGARTVVLAFDGDAAGQRAALRALETLREVVLSEAIAVRILTLPEGEDPDTLCRGQGAEAMSALIEAAPSWVEWWLEGELAKVDLASADSIAAADAGVRRILRVLPAGGVRDYVRRRAAQALGEAPSVPPARPVAKRGGIAWQRRLHAERRALRLYLLAPESRDLLREMMALRLPPYAMGYAIAQALEALGAADELLLAAFSGAIRALPEDDYRELQGLCCPVPDVRRVILDPGTFAGELQAAVDQLIATAAEEATAGEEP
jgi:DNA primase